ncbi:MAG: hypothetical protein QOJ98_1507 [Acidobacteriota bacterium]|jgi:glutathione synthase/RimK-type ligase-like ATP-grasp enzyme|nr:hypothetical protein [Acidobacteriota bacterium]
MNEILIITEAGDIHAYAVAVALQRKGAGPVVWHTSNFPSRAGYSISVEEDATLSVRDGALDLAGRGFDVVWHRRPAAVLDEQALHPADLAYARDAVLELNIAALDFWPDAFWVNPRDHALAASSKPRQQKLALEAGLRTPHTLYSNDPGRIRNFIRRHGGRVVFKTLADARWSHEEKQYGVYTTPLTEEQLVGDALLRNAPGIYQELVPKLFELRVTVIGDRLAAAKILSQETVTGRLDWRKAYAELRMEPFELPAAIAAKTLALTRALGLVFGCVDFIVTPSGEYVFLEINQMGQFTFVEHYTGLPVTDMFAEMLLQGRPDFEWRESAATARYADIHPIAEQMMFEAERTEVVRKVTPQNERVA